MNFYEIISFGIIGIIAGAIAETSVGSRDFAVIRKSKFFIDKTLLIEEAANDFFKRFLVTAPPGFGKSVNLDMLKRFFEILPDQKAVEANRELFKDTKIWRNEAFVNARFGKYPVIYLDFATTGENASFENAVEHVRDVLHKEYIRHGYLQTSPKLRSCSKKYVKFWSDRNKIKSFTDLDDIFSSLENLAQYLMEHFNKPVFVLVDEYDRMTTDSIILLSNEEEIEDINDFYEKCLHCLFKYSDCVGFGLMTGISYRPMGTGNLNNIRIFRFQGDHKFSPFYGVHKTELKTLLSRFRKNSEFDEVVKYYNGYRSDTLNPWSLMNYLKYGRLKSYWRQESMAEQLRIVIQRNSNARKQAYALLSNTKSEISISYQRWMQMEDIFKLKNMIKKPKDYFRKDIFFYVLLELGYLTISNTSVPHPSKKIMVKIPNKEIWEQFNATVTAIN